MNCCVARCTNDAQYKCPRCHAHYCSVPCYRAHSQSCVQAFSHQASAQLAGITASDTEKARFNALLNRLRRDPELQLFHEQCSPPAPADLEQRLDNSDVSEPDSEQDEELPESHLESSGKPHILEELISSLDDEQKRAFFSVFNASMERAYSSSLTTPHSDDREKNKRPQRMHRASQSSFTPNMSTNTSQPEHLESRQQDADALEELVEDMEQFNLTYEQILSRLPPQLAEKFRDELNSRRLQHSLKPWRPWWQASPRPDEDDEQASELPHLPKREDLLVSPDIPQRNASAHLINSVIDVLHAVCLTLRLYDGDCLSDSFHAAKTIWSLSSVLSADARYLTADQACRACVSKTSKAHGKEVAYLALEDVAAVLGGCSDWVTRCLFYAQTVLQRSRAKVRVRKGRKTIKDGTRKVAYMVAWALCERTSSFQKVARKVGSFVEIERGRCKELRVAERAVDLVKNNHRCKGVVQEESTS